MDLFKWNDDFSKQILGAMQYVFSDAGVRPLNQNQIKILQAFNCFLFQQGTALDLQQMYSPDAIGALNLDTNHSQRLLMCLVLLPYLDKTPNKAGMLLLHDYVDSLEISLSSYDMMLQVARQRLHVSDYCLLRQHVAALRESEIKTNALTVWQAMKASTEDKKLLTRYERLKTLPIASLGNQLFDHYNIHAYALPGEPYSLKNGLVLIHDLSNILGGFTENTQGVLNHAFFQAGFCKHYGLLFPVIALINSASDRCLEGKPCLFERSDHIVLEAIKKAYKRGCSMVVDLYDNWDYWADFRRPMSSLRENFKIDH